MSEIDRYIDSIELTAAGPIESAVWEFTSLTSVLNRFRQTP
jgi:hypothetical protein